MPLIKFSSFEGVYYGWVRMGVLHSIFYNGGGNKYTVVLQKRVFYSTEIFPDFIQKGASGGEHTQ